MTTETKAIRITKRNRDKRAAILLEAFPAMRDIETVLETIADAKDTHQAEDAIEAFLDAQNTGSKVPPRYKAKYAANGDPRSCGDDFAKAFADLVTVRGVNGKPTCDTGLLREIADHNDAWNPKYENLNTGMQRMNVGNRLRARVKKGEKIWWPDNSASWAA